MKSQLANRILKVKPSPTLALDAEVKQLQAQGITIVNLTIGEPDFRTPKNISQAAIQAIKSGFTHYTPSAGIMELRSQIAKKLKLENHINYQASEVMVGVGTKQILSLIFMTICNPGDEVIVPTPTWSTYIEQIKLTGAKPVLVPTTAPFHVTAALLESAITPKTKAIVLNYPCNPSGMTIGKTELERIAKLAVKHQVLVIADEIYEKIVYNRSHYSIAAVSQAIKELTVTVNGFSKAYAMTGWRVGYAAGPKPIIDAMAMLAGNLTSGTASISQKAALAALTEDQASIQEMVQEFKVRSELVYAKLSQIKRVKISKPEGAFYAFLDISKLLDRNCKTATDWAAKLLAEKRVAVVPGEAFCAPGYIRISFAAPEKVLNQGLEKIQAFIEESV